MLLSFAQFQSYTPAKPTFALFGYPLGHTMSPQLHTALFATYQLDADYIAVAVPPEHLAEALVLAKTKLQGINLTIPHKKAIIPLLDAVDASAQDLHSVNTVAFHDGKTTGYNTDILGFAASLTKDQVELPGKKVLMLGYGGAAAVMGYHCAKSGASLVITGRNAQKADTLAQQLRAVLPHAKISACSKKHIPRDTQMVLNSTPLGMFPKEDACPLRFLPHKTEYVFDAIYNPPITATIRLAGNRSKIQTRDGLHMLVMQAAHAQTIWNGHSFSNEVCDSILSQLYGSLAVKRLHDKYGKQNIVLCGFMGSGKTTAGRRIAKLCGLRFVDADHYLEEQEGMDIPTIFQKHGEAYFRERESYYLAELSKQQGLVLALGGGAVLRPANVAILKETGLLIHLDTPLYRILKNISYSNNRPLLEQNADKEAQTRKLYHARKSIYRSVANFSVRSSRLHELVLRVIQSI